MTKFLSSFQNFALLFSRIYMGLVFIPSGYGKFMHLERTIGYFQSLEIPYAKIQAPVVAAIELMGGIAIVLGFKTRIIAFGLFVVMCVAIFTTKRSEFLGFFSIADITEVAYACLLLLLASIGSGRFSVRQD